jgi:hypothetical protein
LQLHSRASLELCRHKAATSSSSVSCLIMSRMILTQASHCCLLSLPQVECNIPLVPTR